MADLKQEFEYYLENKETFLADHKGKFIVIKDKSILGVYSDRIEAIQETIKNHELGTFLVQLVSEQDDEVRFHSRVAV